MHNTRKGFTLCNLAAMMMAVMTVIVIAVGFKSMRTKGIPTHKQGALTPPAYAVAAAEVEAVSVDRPYPVPDKAIASLAVDWFGCFHSVGKGGNPQVYVPNIEVGVREDGVVVWRKRPDWR